MRNTINMVLDMSSLKEAKNTLHKTPHQLNEWIFSVAKDFESELEARHIRIDYQLDEHIGQVSFRRSQMYDRLIEPINECAEVQPFGHDDHRIQRITGW